MEVRSRWLACRCRGAHCPHGAPTGIGSWPGTDIREALRVVRDLLAEAPEGVTTMPYLPELPARGPGTDLVGRSTRIS